MLSECSWFRITYTDANPTQFVCYLPFGQAFVDEHTTRPEMPYKFNGKEQDSLSRSYIGKQTGLYYYGARYYDAVEGRFLGLTRWRRKHLHGLLIDMGLTIRLDLLTQMGELKKKG